MHKELRPEQIDILVGTPAVNDEFSKKIRELDRRLQKNGMSYRDWEVLNDRQHAIFSHDMFLDGECATSVKDYVMGAVDSCWCPDVVEDLHHHSPVLMREIEKQQDMLPDMKVKIGESLNNLNEIIDLLLEQVVEEDLASQEEIRRKHKALVMKVLKRKLNQQAQSQLDRKPVEPAIKAIEKFIVDEFTAEVDNLSLSDARRTMLNAVEKAKQKYVRSGKINQRVFDQLVRPYQKALEDPKSKGVRTKLGGPAQVAKERDPNAKFKEMLAKSIDDNETLEQAMGDIQGVRFGFLSQMVKYGVPFTIRADRSGSPDQALGSPTYGDVLPLPLVVDKDKMYGNVTFLTVLEKILEPMAAIAKQPLTPLDKQKKMKELLDSALEKGNLLIPDITNARGTLEFPVDLDATTEKMKDFLGTDISSEYSDQEWGLMLADAGIEIPETFTMSQIIKTPELGGKGRGTAKETAHMIYFNAEVEKELGSTPSPKNPYTLTIKKNSQGGDLVGGVIEGVTGPLKQPNGDPKADYIMPTSDGEVFISHKDGETVKDFQQWGGVSKSSTVSAVKTFMEYLPEAPGIVADSSYESGLKMLEATTLVYDPSIGTSQDNSWKEFLLRGLFGKDLSTDDRGILPEQTPGLNNVNFVVQHEMKVDKSGDKKLNMLPTHALSLASIQGRTFDEAYNTLFGADSGYFEYTPVVMGNYRSNRKNLQVGGMRAGIYPASNRKTTAILVPEDGTYVWKDKDEFMKYVDNLEADDKIKKALKNKFDWGRG